MELSQVLSIVAGLGYATAFVVYNWKVFRGETRPNGATWAIWSLIALVSTPSYLTVTGDKWMSVIPLLNIGLCALTFVLALVLGKFEKIDWWDGLALIVGAVAAMVWKATGSAIVANVIVNGAILIGFVPTWRGIWKCTAEENGLAWWIWTGSYCLAIAVIILRWKHQWIDLLYPVSCAILHASVPIVSLVLAYAGLAPDSVWSEFDSVSKTLPEAEQGYRLHMGGDIAYLYEHLQKLRGRKKQLERRLGLS